MMQKCVKFSVLFFLLISTASVFADRKDTLIHYSGKVYETKIDTDKKITYKNAIFKLFKTSIDFFTSNAAQHTEVSCYLGDDLIQKDTVNADGGYSIDLLYDKNYKIELKKEGYYTSTILIDTKNVPLRIHKKGLQVSSEVDVIKKDHRVEQFEFPMIKIAFNPKEMEFKQDESHNEFVHAELERIRIDLTKAIVVEKEVSRLSEEAKLKLNDYTLQGKKEADAEIKKMMESAQTKADSILKQAQLTAVDVSKKNNQPKNLRKDSVVDYSSEQHVDFSNGVDVGLIMGGNIQLDTKKDQVENARKSLELAKLKASTKLDSLLIIEREAKILAAENEILQAEQKLKDAQKEIDSKNNQLAQEKMQRNALFFGLSLFIILVFVLFSSMKRKKKDHKIILQQKLEVEEQHKEIKDSINYAQRIQSALLTSETEWKKISDDYLVFFKPRDVVSGDFFWAHHDTEKNISIWATADCTGHGVPGAFMSVLGIGFLNEIVIEGGEKSPDKVLEELRKKIINALIKNESDDQQKDGMDISICVLDRTTNQLNYAGANNSILVLKNIDHLTEDHKADAKTMTHQENKKAIIELKADKQPVGAHAELKPFNTSSINLNKGDVVISFTDGYPDQFGGEKGKKLKYRPFKQMFLDNNFESLTYLKEHIEFSFENWKGELDQIDDVCIVAVRV